MSEPIHCLAISWAQCERLVREVAAKIHADHFQPDLIAAIARGGYVPARLLCDQLGVMELASFRIAHYHGQQIEAQARIQHPLNVAVNGKRVLIVDDLSDTGETFDVAVRHLKEIGAAEVRTAALHYKQQSKFEPDYYAKRIKQWRWISYPWARMEDVSELIRGLDQPWGDAGQVAHKLQVRHGLRVQRQIVEDALVLMR